MWVARISIPTRACACHPRWLGISALLAKTRTDGKEHTFTVFGRQYGTLVLASVPGFKSTQRDRVANYVSAKFVQTKERQVMCVYFDASDPQSGFPNIEVSIVEDMDAISPEVEAVVEYLRRKSISEAFAKGERPGPNALCPCGSGIKYKKCCLGT